MAEGVVHSLVDFRGDTHVRGHGNRLPALFAQFIRKAL